MGLAQRGFFFMHKSDYGQKKVHKVMKEFKGGSLRSSSGAKVKKRKQAIAIAMSEAGLSRGQKRSTKGSPSFGGSELQRGYRKI